MCVFLHLHREVSSGTVLTEYDWSVCQPLLHQFFFCFVTYNLLINIQNNNTGSTKTTPLSLSFINYIFYIDIPSSTLSVLGKDLRSTKSKVPSLSFFFFPFAGLNSSSLGSFLLLSFRPECALSLLSSSLWIFYAGYWHEHVVVVEEVEERLWIKKRGNIEKKTLAIHRYFCGENQWKLETESKPNQLNVEMIFMSANLSLASLFMRGASESETGSWGRKMVLLRFFLLLRFLQKL